MAPHEITLLRPKKYFIQYLLVPVRIIISILLFGCLMIVVLLCKAYLAIIGLMAVGIILGCGWLIDAYVWHDFSKSFAAAPLAILLIYPTWFGVAWLLGCLIERLWVLTGLPKIAEPFRNKIDSYLDWAEDFVGEAKYTQSYIELYGPNFPRPTLSEFGLEAEEYYAYNRRFSFNGFEFPLAMLAGFVGVWVASYTSNTPQHFLIWLIVATFTYLALFTFERWLARRKPHHYKVCNYQQALKIYESIQTDIRNAQSK